MDTNDTLPPWVCTNKLSTTKTIKSFIVVGWRVMYVCNKPSKRVWGSEG